MRNSSQRFFTWAFKRRGITSETRSTTRPARCDCPNSSCDSQRAHTLCVLEISDCTSAQARIVGQVPREAIKGHLAEQRKYGMYWSQLIEAADRSGSLRPVTDLFVALMLVLGALNWTAEWFSPKRGASALAVADQAVAMALCGVAKPGHEAELGLAFGKREARKTKSARSSRATPATKRRT